MNLLLKIPYSLMERQLWLLMKEEGMRSFLVRHYKNGYYIQNSNKEKIMYHKAILQRKKTKLYCR